MSNIAKRQTDLVATEHGDITASTVMLNKAQVETYLDNLCTDINTELNKKIGGYSFVTRTPTSSDIEVFDLYVGDNDNPSGTLSPSGNPNEWTSDSISIDFEGPAVLTRRVASEELQLVAYSLDLYYTDDSEPTWSYTVDGDGTASVDDDVITLTGDGPGLKLRRRVTSGEKVLTVDPFTITQVESSENMSIEIGALPTGLTNVSRDAFLVIDCSSISDVPQLTWPSNYVPSYEMLGNLKLEPLAKNIFRITETGNDSFIVTKFVQLAPVQPYWIVKNTAGEIIGKMEALTNNSWRADNISDFIDGYGNGYMVLERVEMSVPDRVGYRCQWHPYNEPASVDYVFIGEGDDLVDADATTIKFRSTDDMKQDIMEMDLVSADSMPPRNRYKLSTSSDVADAIKLIANAIGAEEVSSSGILTDKANVSDVYTKDQADDRFLREHQQLQPIYGGNGQKFTGDWKFYRVVGDNPDVGGVDVTSQVHNKTPVYTEGYWYIDDCVIDGDTMTSTVGEYGADAEVLYYEAVSDPAGESVSLTYKAVRAKNPIIGYVLGDQTPHLQPQGNYLTEHQSWNDVKPSGGIPKTDLASTVQTSLDKADALASKIAAAAAVAISDSNDITVRELRTAILAIQAALVS